MTEAMLVVWLTSIPNDCLVIMSSVYCVDRQAPPGFILVMPMASVIVVWHFLMFYELGVLPRIAL